MNLTKGRKEPCKNNIGGIDKIYLASFVDYSEQEVSGYRDQQITSFPSTQVYLYEGVNKSFSENINNDGSYSQEISIKLHKQDSDSIDLLSDLIKNKVRALVVDRLGKIRVVGCMNGLDVEVNSLIGGSKSDFIGYELKMSGMEEFQSPFILDLVNFGFTEDEVNLGCILASSGLSSSIGYKVSSCSVATEEQSITVGCILASTYKTSSLENIISSCNIEL